MSSRLLLPVRTWEARRALRDARRRADAELVNTLLPPPRLAWRASELVSNENRLDLARSLTDVVHASDERLLPAASPLARTAVRACRAPLLALAARLCDLASPVRPRGVLLVERLLAGGGSPLYGAPDPDRLRAAARRAHAALDGPE